nr:hypothetical protein [Acinetobacter baumannii]
MTDLNKLRSEFENLSEIAEILNEEKSHFNGDFYNLPFNSCAESFINGAWYAWQVKAKAQAVPEGYVLVPKGVLDLTRFMCKTWAEIDNFVYKNCTNLGEYPVIQGTSNQFNLAKIGNQKVDNKFIHSGVKWFLESESGAEG